MIFSTLFALSVAFVWLDFFGRKENYFQTFWIHYLGVKRIKQYTFIFLPLIVLLILLQPNFLFKSIPTGLENYLGLMSYHFFILFSATFVVAGAVGISPNSIRKHSKIYLELIRERFPKNPRKRVSKLTEEYTSVFPYVIKKANTLLNRYHVEDRPFWIFSASHPPRILNKDDYPKKLLIADLVQDKKFLDDHDKQRLKDIREGLEKMSNSLEIKEDGFLYPFVEGLTQIANSGEEKQLFSVEDGIDLKAPSTTRLINEHYLIITFILSVTVFILNILLPILTTLM